MSFLRIAQGTLRARRCPTSHKSISLIARRALSTTTSRHSHLLASIQNILLVQKPQDLRVANAVQKVVRYASEQGIPPFSSVSRRLAHSSTFYLSVVTFMKNILMSTSFTSHHPFTLPIRR